MLEALYLIRETRSAECAAFSICSGCLVAAAANDPGYVKHRLKPASCQLRRLLGNWENMLNLQRLRLLLLSAFLLCSVGRDGEVIVDI